VRAALQRLSDLVSRGYQADRIGREAEALIAGWKEALPPDELRERLEEMHEQLAAGVEAAEEQISEMGGGDSAASRAASRTLAALAQARDSFRSPT
jgi:tryptophanase